MIRALLLVGAMALTARQPVGPPVSPTPCLPVSLKDAAESSRSAWQRRDLAAFVAASGGGKLLVTLPGGQESSPITPRQAEAMLSAYVQGSQEVTTVLQEAVEVDSTGGYGRLLRRYRVVGVPGDRESPILLGFRLKKDGWTLTEVRIAL